MKNPRRESKAKRQARTAKARSVKESKRLARLSPGERLTRADLASLTLEEKCYRLAYNGGENADIMKSLGLTYEQLPQDTLEKARASMRIDLTVSLALRAREGNASALKMLGDVWLSPTRDLTWAEAFRSKVRKIIAKVKESA